ncbi:MAG: cation:proton antiporter subunit C [Clostridiaceae bacterium]
MSLTNLFLISSTSLIFVGLYGILTKKNIVRILLSLNIIETGINLLIVAFGYVEGGITPIITSSESIANLAKMVDPMPQALVLTSIVIGLGTTAFALGLTINYYKNFGTVSISKEEEEEINE